MSRFLMNIVTCVCLWFFGCSSQENKVYVTPMHVDLGVVDDVEKPVTAEFTIYNHTEQELVIRDVLPSCTCTSVQVEKKSISPGESARLIAKADLPDSAGIQEYFIAVQTDHPAFPAFELTFNAAVQVSEGQKRDFTVGTYYPGAPIDLEIPSMSLSDGQLLGVAGPSDTGMQVELSGGDGVGQTLKLSGRVPNEVGPFEHVVRIQLAYPEESGLGAGILRLRLTGLIVSRWDVPDSFYAGFHSREKGNAAVHVQIDSNAVSNRQPVAIRDVRVSAGSSWLSLNRYEVSESTIDLHFRIHPDRLPTSGALSNPIQLEIEYSDGNVERHLATLYIHT